MKTTIPFVATLYIGFLALTSFASAAAGKLAQPAPGAGATLQDFIYLLISIIQAVGTPVLVVCIIYAGYILVTAGGNEEKVTKGKIWIFWTLIGAAIIVGANVIAGMIFNTAALF